MNPETLKALKGSIRKWERIVLGLEADKGTSNCPLCIKFVVPTCSCKGCPVYTKTKRSLCAGSPYMKWDEVWQKEVDQLGGKRHQWSMDPRVVIGPETQQAAIDEYNFLVSLLPHE